MKEQLNEVKRMQRLAGIIVESTESVKPEDKVRVDGKEYMVIATDKQNEMRITPQVEEILTARGASPEDFAIIVPISPFGEYNYDMGGDQFVATSDKLIIKKRTELKK